MRTQFPMIVKQGEDYSFSVRWPGEDLSAASAKIQMRAKPNEDVLAEFYSPDNGIVFTATDDSQNPLLHVDTMRVTIAGGTSSEWTFLRAAYDMFLTLAGGAKICLIEGSVTLIPQVTR